MICRACAVSWEGDNACWCCGRPGHEGHFWEGVMPAVWPHGMPNGVPPDALTRAPAGSDQHRVRSAAESA